MRKSNLLASLLAIAVMPLLAMVAPANMTVNAPRAGRHYAPAIGKTGALKIRRAATKRRNVTRNRRAHRG